MNRFLKDTMDNNPDTRISLIARICDSSDHDAWSEFVEIYQPVVHRFVQKYGLQYADTVEITQEVLSSVVRSIESWDVDKPKSTFRGWLYRITRNQTIDFLRKRKQELNIQGVQNSAISQIAAPSNSESAEFHREFEKELFLWAARKLKPLFHETNWQAFWLSTVEGINIPEVASLLKIEPGKVYVARSRIVARMSKLIQARLDETTNG